MSSDINEKPETSKSSVFADMLDRIVNEVAKKEARPPVVKPSVVEWCAGRMMAHGYEFTPNTLEILTDYLKGYNLLLCGLVGVGKTFFFDCINRVRREKDRTEIAKLSMIETQGWDMDMARNWVDDTCDLDVVIDDVGTEPKMKSWGQEAELFPYLLEKRMQITGRRTHLTTNLSMDEARERYGLRVRDRFDQMFKKEVITQKKSRRKQSLKPWRVSSSGDGVL